VKKLINSKISQDEYEVFVPFCCTFMHHSGEKNILDKKCLNLNCDKVLISIKNYYRHNN
jgi:hypothetical protein